MLDPVVILGPALVFLTAIGFAALARATDRRAWYEPARAAGITAIVFSRFSLSQELLRGRMGSRVVRIGYFSRGKKESGVRIVVEGRSGLTLLRDVDTSTLDLLIRGRDLETGDEEFDRLVYVQGDPGTLRAALDASTRRMVLDFLDGPLKARAATLKCRTAVEHGRVAFESGEREELLAAKLRDVIERLAAVADRLEVPATAQRLIAVAPADPEWRVRLETYRLLAERYPRHAAVREALLRGCSDERQEVQLECALGLDAESGRAVLLEIASREWADDPVAARAVAALGRALPAERALSILAHALRTRRQQTAQACLEALGHGGDGAVVDTLAKVMRVERGPLALAAARALGASGAAAEGPLLDALESGAADLRAAAAEALGHAGSPAAIVALKEAAQSDGGLRRVARQAIAEIQARKGVSPGQLSLAAGESGDLSLVDHEPRGRLSVADPGRGAG